MFVVISLSLVLSVVQTFAPATMQSVNPAKPSLCHFPRCCQNQYLLSEVFCQDLELQANAVAKGIKTPALKALKANRTEPISMSTSGYRPLTRQGTGSRDEVFSGKVSKEFLILTSTEPKSEINGASPLT